MRPDDMPLVETSRLAALALVNHINQPQDTGPRRAFVQMEVPGALKAEDRDFLVRYAHQLTEYGGQLERMARGVDLRGIDGVTQAELFAVGRACGTLLHKIGVRLEQDKAARMVGKRNTQLKRAA
ncbi:hypothetical protein HNQ50_001392 [Silvimonas terrae]|uniref:Uncharacterized protein n=1 Tax=Silvimonas terrae TaxID=300266 RepID=A0A840RE72_9NEIS|nr:hypothetical protein [Silvimonas terrae]MBB5190670.1 hypothetical protein [Silvimonas terrae]